MNKSTLRHAILEAVKDVFGQDAIYVHPYSSKLKDGTRVYRFSGSGWGAGALYKRDGKIWMRPGKNAEPVHVTEAIANGDYQRHDLNFWKWEWQLLDRGPEVIEDQLQKALRARGVHNIEVQIGGDTAYTTSMAFKVLGSNKKKQGPPAELTLLFAALPSPGEPWPAAQRKRWIETAECMFDLMYGPAQ
jgi:hypothetical protein